MQDWLDQAQTWQTDGDRVALATVVRVVGSAPRPLGAKLIVSSSGRMAGSVSGGCVETTVYQEALDVLETGQPRLLHFGISDEEGWEVGLACGGEIDVWVEPLAPALCAALRGGIEADQPCALATVVEPEAARGGKALFAADGSLLYGVGLSSLPGLAQAARTALETGQAGTVSLDDPAVELFVEPFLPPPTLIVIGGVHVAVPLVRFAKALGFWVVVADPRAHFARPERFPQADQILVEWPDEALAHLPLDANTYVTILTHDPKIDEPALSSLLGSSGEAAPVRYVGAIGSRQTHAARFERLARLGVEAERLEGVYAPIGLDLGGRTPAEIALSIMAEIVAVKNGRSGGSLRHSSGPIGG